MGHEGYSRKRRSIYFRRITLPIEELFAVNGVFFLLCVRATCLARFSDTLPIVCMRIVRCCFCCHSTTTLFGRTKYARIRNCMAKIVFTLCALHIC